MARLTTGNVLALVGLVVALVFPFVFRTNSYFLDVAIKIFIFGIAASGLNVLLGFTGLLNLSHAGFFGIGAYTAGILTLKLGWSFWLALPAAIALASLLGFLLGLVAFRTRGDAFAIFTLAVGVIITSIVQRWDTLTGGRDGLNGVPPVTAIGPISFERNFNFYFLALAALLITLYVVRAVVRAPVGQAFVAVRSNEDLARASGIDVFAHKQRSLMLSTGIAGLAGALFAGYQGFLGYASTAVDQTFEMLLYIIVGGAGTLAGPILGSLLFNIVSQFLQGLGEAKFIIFGPLLVVLVLFAPHGLMGLWMRLEARLKRPAVPAAPVPAATKGEGS